MDMYGRSSYLIVMQCDKRRCVVLYVCAAKKFDFV
jgi:hypothetical protein